MTSNDFLVYYGLKKGKKEEKEGGKCKVFCGNYFTEDWTAEIKWPDTLYFYAWSNGYGTKVKNEKIIIRK